MKAPPFFRELLSFDRETFQISVAISVWNIYNIGNVSKIRA